MLSDAIADNLELVEMPNWEALDDEIEHYFSSPVFGYSMDVQELVRAWVEVRNAEVLV